MKFLSKQLKIIIVLVILIFSSFGVFGDGTPGQETEQERSEEYSGTEEVHADDATQGVDIGAGPSTTSVDDTGGEDPTGSCSVPGETKESSCGYLGTGTNTSTCMDTSFDPFSSNYEWVITSDCTGEDIPDYGAVTTGYLRIYQSTDDGVTVGRNIYSDATDLCLGEDTDDSLTLNKDAGDWSDGGTYCSELGDYYAEISCGSATSSNTKSCTGLSTTSCEKNSQGDENVRIYGKIYTVAWESETYCISTCYNSNYWSTASPEWNITGGTGDCCGDHSNEFPTQCSDSYTSNSDPSCSSTEKYCCSSEDSCVNNSGGCISASQCAPLGSAIAYCYNASWQDPDEIESYCTVCGTSIGDSYSWYNDGDASAGETCCGDDEAEQWCAGTTAACHDAEFYQDPDDNSWLCESCDETSLQRDWVDGVNCCGDDTGDCGLSAADSNYLCSNESNAYTWLSSSEKQGDIHYVLCDDKEYLANGSLWEICDGTFWEKTSNKSSGGDYKHNYVCFSTGRESIAECSGDNAAYSTASTGGLIKSTGKNITYSNSVYYCADDFDWTTDLDVKNENSCENADYEWTGNYCCSEYDDDNEYYNDTSGGCWDKIMVENTELVPDYNEIVVEDGEFHGCAIDEDWAIDNNIEGDPLRDEKKPYKTDNDDLLELDSCPNPGVDTCDTSKDDLITDHTYCDIISSGSTERFCSYKEEWELTNDKNRSHLSYINWSDDIYDWVNTDLQEAECCEPSQCWNGSTCTSNQAADPRELPYKETGLRCVDGEWKESNLVMTWDKEDEGYCPKRSQCLVNPDGTYDYNDNPSMYSYRGDSYFNNPYDNDNPQCIEDGQYIGNHYCENGNWTTRTKLVALQLLSITELSNDPDDYVLFCDSYEDVLNYYEYLLEESFNYIEEYLKKGSGSDSCEMYPESYPAGVNVPCVNKMCVLKYKKDDDNYGVVFGTSLNQPINATEMPFLEALGKTYDYCYGAFEYDDNKFHSCDGSDDEFDTWYHKELQLVVYSKDGVLLTEITFWDKFVYFIKNPFETMFDTIINIIIPTYESRYETGAKIDYDFIEKTTDFNRLYLNSKGTKTIKGVTEVIADNEFFAINYGGFSEDICESVNTYIENIGEHTDIINCNEEGDSNYYVETRYESRLGVWYDLTSKLRVE